MPIRCRHLGLTGVSLVILSLGCSSSGHAAPPPSSSRLSPKTAASASPRAAGSVSSAVFVKSESTVSRPFSISRVFAEGDIPHFATAVFDGNPVATQCDVKTRWPDGSLQHAVLSFWAAPGSNTSRVDFLDSLAPTSEGALTAEQMLSSSFDLGASIEITAQDSTLSADIRKMISAGAFRYWLQGPICTQVIVEDRSPARAFDLGWDDRRPFHPAFIATFYKGWRGVKIDYIGEVPWADALQDLNYSLDLKAGPDLASFYQKSNYPHAHSTRWRKTSWSGPAPDYAAIDFNLAYLIHSRVLPNFNLARRPSNSAIQAEYDRFLKSDKGDLGGHGSFNPYFPNTGGRDEIGLFPGWDVRYVFTFDPRMEAVFFGNAAISGYTPVHIREAASRAFLSDSDQSGFGKVISIEARPSIWINNWTSGLTKAEDRITAITAASTSGWTIDRAHQPQLGFLPYILTGDYYFLEELHFWAAYNVGAGNEGSCNYCRNKTWGIIIDQVRGRAWATRNIALAAFATPDDQPEKTYFTDKLYRNIAAWEGVADVRDGSFYDPAPSSPWTYGRAILASGKPNPLHFLDNLGTANTDGPTVKDQTSPYYVSSNTSQWMNNFVHIVYGYIDELGYPIGPLRRSFALNLIGQFTHPDLNHYLVAAYRSPLMGPDKAWIQSWDNYIRSWDTSSLTFTPWPGSTTDVVHGYPQIARAAASYLPGICSDLGCGDQAWTWINTNLPHQELFNDNPKWDILPRSAQPAAILADFANRRPAGFRPKLLANRKKNR